MKIAELEANHVACVDAEQTIRTMVENREFPAVFSVCVESFPYIVPAIQFRKKRELTPEVPILLAFTTICRYAPPLFEHAAIESLHEFVKSTRLLAQHENDYLSAIEAARNCEEVAHALWNHLEKEPGALQRDLCKQLGTTREYPVKIIELWEELGIIDRQQEDGSYRVHFRTQPDREVVGLCQNCGACGKGRKEVFFGPTTCTECGTKSYFYIEYGDTPQ
jgi:hypothetical protein